jgi:hypothetical protein
LVLDFGFLPDFDERALSSPRSLCFFWQKTYPKYVWVNLIVTHFSWKNCYLTITALHHGFSSTMAWIFMRVRDS